ncbi:MAG: transporter substrate-binding domain-containing protein [Clostridia bacterium]
MKMKKFFCLILALMFTLSFAACNSDKPVDDMTPLKKSGVLRVGMECNYAPFNWMQKDPSATAVAITSGGYADGYDVQIAKILAGKLGLKLEIYPMKWEGLIPALQSNVIDCIVAGMSPNAERKLTVDFSDCYYESKLVVVVKKDAKYASAKKLSDFSGAKITGQLNTFHYGVIDQINGVNKQTALPDFPNMIVALQSGTIDGYISEEPGAISAITANSDLTYVKFAEGSGFNTKAEDTSIAVAIRKNSNLKDELNKALAEISKEKRDETMNAAYKNQPVSKE